MNYSQKQAELARLRAEIARLEGDSAAGKPDEPDDMALARLANLPASHKTREKLAEIGFYRLRIQD